jgi:hypothetical protein
VSEAVTAAKTKQRLIFFWAVAATPAALMFANCALLLFLRTRELAAAVRRANAAANQNSPGSPFLTLNETDLPGRYKFFEGGEELGIMTLTPDHKFINKDGTTFPQYRLEILRDGMLIVWERATTRFTEMPDPGVFVARGPNGKEQRLERIVEQTP